MITRWLVPVAMLVGALVAAGCGGGGSSAADLDLEGIKSRLNEAGIACDGEPAPYEKAPDELDFGVEVAETLKCSDSGTEIEATMFESTADAALAIEAIRGLGCAFGMKDFQYVSEGAWMVGATIHGSDDATDEEMIKDIADALDSEVKTLDCDESTNKEAKASTTLLDSSELVPVDEAERNDAQQAVIGESVDVGEGLFLEVQGVDVGGDGEPWLTIEARAENRGGEAASIPDVAVVCAGATDGDGWLGDSTFPMYGEVNAGAFAEGTLNLLPTGNSRTGDPIEPCDAPAVVRINAAGANVDIEVPEGVLDDYNAAAGN